MDAQKLEAFRSMLLNNVIRGPKSARLSQWASHQIYIALGNLLTSAAVMGIDACPMAGIDTGKYDELLGLESLRLRSVVACALGFRSPSDTYAALPKVRHPEDELFLTR
jgi:nitroreductase